MKNVALSIAVAVALVAAFIYGVEFGRKVEHDSVVNARADVPAASSYSTYSYSYTPDEGHTDYTPSK